MRLTRKGGGRGESLCFSHQSCLQMMLGDLNLAGVYLKLADLLDIESNQDQLFPSFKRNFSEYLTAYFFAIHLIKSKL